MRRGGIWKYGINDVAGSGAALEVARARGAQLQLGDPAERLQGARRDVSAADAACGRSPIQGLRTQKRQHFVLHLRGEPAEDRQLDAALLAREVPPRLRQRPDRPAHVAQELEAAQLPDRQPAAGQLGVALQERLRISDAAQRLTFVAEAPGANQRPRQVLARISHVRELPIENSHEARIAHHQVADPEVPMTHDALFVARQLAPEAPEAQLDGRMWLTHVVELRLEDLQRAPQWRFVVGARQEWQRTNVESVDARELFRHLCWKRGARRGELRLLDDAASDRFAP